MQVLLMEDWMIIDEVEVCHVHVKEGDGTFDRPSTGRCCCSESTLAKDRCFDHQAACPPGQALSHWSRQTSEQWHHIGKIANQAMCECARMQWHWQEVDGTNTQQSRSNRCWRPHPMEHDVRLQKSESCKLTINEGLCNFLGSKELRPIPAKIVCDRDPSYPRLSGHYVEPSIGDLVFKPRAAGQKIDFQIQALRTLGQQCSSHRDSTSCVASILPGYAKDDVNRAQWHCEKLKVEETRGRSC